MREIKTHQLDILEVYARCSREFLYKDIQSMSLLCSGGDENLSGGLYKNMTS